MRREGKRAAAKSNSLAIATHSGARIGSGFEIFCVAWIQFDRAFKTPQRLRPAALAHVHQCDLIINRSIVRQDPPGKLQLNARAIVIAKPAS